MSAGKLSERNPPWRRDELLLALELYLRQRPRLPGPNSAAVVELSALLNRMVGQTETARFRNANGVAMKLSNFSRLDPQYTTGGRVGLQRGGKGEEAVWRAFADDPARLHDAAAAIRAAVLAGATVAAGADDANEGFAEAEEGRLLTRLHRERERSGKLVARRKEQALAGDGCLRCEACGFDFEQRYGARGRGFIECHHTRPVHTLRPGDRTRLAELAMVCANCHRMIHARQPWLSVAELRDLLR